MSNNSLGIKSIRSFQRGISLVEVLLSVSVISIILILATRYYFQTSRNQQINHTVSEIAGLVSALQAWDRGNADFSGLGSNGILNLYNGGFISKTADLTLTEDNGNISGAVLNNAWGSPISVVGTAGSATISTDLSSAALCQAIANNFPESSCDVDNEFNYVFQ